MHGVTLSALITPGIEGMKRSQLVQPQYARWLVVGFAMLATLLFCPYGSEFTVVLAQAVPAQFEEEEEAEAELAAPTDCTVGAGGRLVPPSPPVPDAK